MNQAMHNRIIQILFFSLILFAFSACNQNRQFNATNLKVDYTSRLIGADNPTPLLSWQMQDETIGAKQTAFQILVASSSKLLEEGKADLWDSGKMMGATSKIQYNGSPLQSCRQYFWTVRIWNQNGGESSFCYSGYV